MDWGESIVRFCGGVGGVTGGTGCALPVAGADWHWRELAVLARGRVAYAPPAEAGTDGVSGRGGGGPCVFWVESEPLSDASLTRPTAFSCAAVSVWVCFPCRRWPRTTGDWLSALFVTCAALPDSPLPPRPLTCPTLSLLATPRRSPSFVDQASVLPDVGHVPGSCPLVAAAWTQYRSLPPALAPYLWVNNGKATGPLPPEVAPKEAAAVFLPGRCAAEGGGAGRS